MTGPIGSLSEFARARFPLLVVLGSVFFSLTWFFLGFFNDGYTLYGTTVSSYSVVAQPISGLGLGKTGLLMNLGFILFGGLLVAMGLSGILFLNRGSGPVLLVGDILLFALPIGSAISGVYTLQDGFPHYFGAMLAFGVPILAFPLVALGLRKKTASNRVWLVILLGSPITLLLLVLYLATFNPTDAGNNMGIAGLTERLLVTWEMAVYSIYALHVSRPLDRY